MNTLVTATQCLSQPLLVKDCRVRHEGNENGKKRHFRMSAFEARMPRIGMDCTDRCTITGVSDLRVGEMSYHITH